MTREEMCREFCELNGMHWHEDIQDIENGKLIGYPVWVCNCGYRSTFPPPNHTFSDAKSILEVMDKRTDAKLFYANLIYSGNVEGIDDDGLIPREYILNPDKLLSVALDWCREHPIKQERN